MPIQSRFQSRSCLLVVPNSQRLQSRGTCCDTGRSRADFKVILHLSRHVKRTSSARDDAQKSNDGKDEDEATLRHDV